MTLLRFWSQRLETKLSMSIRVWGYGLFFLIVLGAVSLWRLELKEIESDLKTNLQAQQVERIKNLEAYLIKQKDERKLVSLIKKIPNEDYEILRRIALRAYELNGQSRDIALIASQFDPKIKEKVIKLDPLHNLK